MSDTQDNGHKVNPADRIQALQLGMRVLESLAQSENGMGVSALARELGTSKTRIYRHLQTLKDSKYVVQDKETERYSLGLRLYFLGEAIAERFDLIAASRRDVRRLRDKLDQTVQVSSVIGEELVILFVARGRGMIDIGMRVGSRYGIHSTAGGKIYMAFGPPSVAEKVLAGPLNKYTDKTVTNPTEIRAELDRVKRKGWAGAPEETLIGVNVLSAPIFGRDGLLAGSIAALGSVQMIPADPPREMIEALKDTAARISRNLGWEPSRG